MPPGCSGPRPPRPDSSTSRSATVSPTTPRFTIEPRDGMPCSRGVLASGCGVKLCRRRQIVERARREDKADAGGCFEGPHSERFSRGASQLGLWQLGQQPRHRVPRPAGGLDRRQALAQLPQSRPNAANTVPVSSPSAWLLLLLPTGRRPSSRQHRESRFLIRFMTCLKKRPCF